MSNSDSVKHTIVPLFFQRAKQATYVAVIAAFVSFGISGDLAAREAPDSFADLTERLSPAVVNISTSQTVSGTNAPIPDLPPGSPFEDLFRDFLDPDKKGRRGRRVSSLGSGFVIDPSGIVVTNNHVIAEADEVKVRLNDGTTLDAEILGKDPKTDIAVLKVESDKPLPFVPFGSSDKARVGDWVLAIGNPFGLGGSVSAGIISARNRDIQSGPYDDFIQTDAAINRGNSGGPLFNLQGQVIGVNTAIISPSGGSIGIGFSIPSALVEPVVKQLRDFGETRRGWIGVRIQTVTEEIAESVGLKKPSGAIVVEVTEDGPAEAAGLEQNDIILTFDGKEVPEMRELPRMVAATEIGKTVQIEVFRDGKTIRETIKVGRLEEAEKVAANSEEDEPEEEDSDAKESLGLTLSSLSRSARNRYDLDDDIRGVLITDVDPESSAAEKGIREGDVIVEVGQKEVKDPDDVIKRVNDIVASKKKSVLLLLNRNGNLTFIAVKAADS